MNQNREKTNPYLTEIEKIVKRRVVRDIRYRCPGCLVTFSTEGEARGCFYGHGEQLVCEGKPGDLVKFDDGHDGGQLGHNAGWWPNVTEYPIITNAGDRYLFERPSGTRGYVSFNRVMAVIKGGQNDQEEKRPKKE